MNDTMQSASRRTDVQTGLKLKRIRPWVQTAFLTVWLAPLGRWFHSVPGCVFHCYSCPLSSFACPIGLMANYAAVLPAVPVMPFLLLGVLLAVGGLVGSLVCGWSCPFGLLQDLLAKLHKRKLLLPPWVTWFRYAVLGVLVLFLPWYFGRHGILYDDQLISICRLCPAGALEAGVPYSVVSLAAGKGWVMSWHKSAILLFFLVGAVFIHRPWCRIFCPLGGLLALFNRVSLFHIRFKSENCGECNLCRSRCAMGVQVDERVNTSACTRCLECTACGALQPTFMAGGNSADKPASPPPSAGIPAA
jgi:ferredoxin-type protein NapH